MIKSCLLLAIVLLSCICIYAQSNNKDIAPFKIELVNGKDFSFNQLEQNKPVILIYFSPSCDHCKTFTEEMLKRMNVLQNSELVMISYVDIKEVKEFDETYKLSSHKNIKIGSEGYTFIVRKYYDIQRFPFVAEYDKRGKLKKIIPSNLTPEEIADQL